MKNLKIIIFTILSAIISLSAQEFKLSDYQAPEISRKELWFEYYTNSEVSYGEFGKFKAEFSYFKKNKIWEMNTKNMIGFGENYQMENYKIKTENELYYYYHNTSFINTKLNSEVFTKNGNNTNTDAAFYIGHGKIDQVEDARLAVYILDDLKEKELLNSYPDNNKIIELAQLITQLKNERFLDTREKRIYEITQLDSFFQANNLVKNANATYFTILTDNWENCGKPARASGNRFMIGSEGNYNYINQRVNSGYNFAGSLSFTNKSDTYVINSQYGFFIKHEWDYPCNLKWQLGNSLKLGYRIADNRKNQYLNGYDEYSGYNQAYYIYPVVKNDTIKVNLSTYEFTDCILIGYNPNSRTSFTLKSTLNIELTNRKYSHKSYNVKWHNTYEDDIDLLDINTKFDLDWRYYYSKNLTFFFNIYGWTKTRQDLSNSDFSHTYYDDDFNGVHELDLEGGTSIGATYSIF